MKSHNATALLTLLPIFYVLSTGPVIMMDLKLNSPPLGIPSAGVLAFYKPLIWFCDKAPPVGIVIESYVKVWLSR